MRSYVKSRTQFQFQFQQDGYLQRDDDGIAQWHHLSHCGAMLQNQGKTIFQFRGEGLKVSHGVD